MYIFHIEISNGAPCSETAQCTDTNAYCTENVCNCKAGYFEDATKENSCTVGKFNILILGLEFSVLNDFLH